MSKEVMFVRALPAPSVTMIVRKAEAAALARASAGRARKRLALLLRKGAPETARPGTPRQVNVAHAKAKLAKGRTIRLALRERSSS